MSEQEQQPKRQAYASGATKHVVIEWDGEPSPVEIWHYPITRYFRNKAISAGVDAYRREHPEDANSTESQGLGGDPTVAERELAIHMIKKWNLDKPPKVVWDFLDPELGDKISQALGLNEMFGVTTKVNEKTGKAELSDAVEVEKAKN